MTVSRARHLATSGLLVAVCLVAAASDAKEGDQKIVSRPAVSAPRDARPFVSFGCYQCHGYVGQGANSGPRLSADMPYEGFQQIVRFPYGGMPAYPRELLRDEDLRAIYSYIKSLPPAPELKDLPLLYDTSKRAGSR
ncbi:MAG TPA: cytochrome c [Steroidobacteraceae bacterium]|nr:cytochrome c [Steroidobacteraceae bacterium]